MQNDRLKQDADGEDALLRFKYPPENDGFEIHSCADFRMELNEGLLTFLRKYGTI